MVLGLPPEGSSRVPAECLECGRENFEVGRVMTPEMVPYCPKCGRVSLAKLLRLLTC